MTLFQRPGNTQARKDQGSQMASAAKKRTTRAKQSSLSGFFTKKSLPGKLKILQHLCIKVAFRG
jgi:hypothetical protein